MVDFEKIKDIMIKDIDKFIHFLEYLGFKNPSLLGDQIIFGWDEDSSGNANKIFIESKMFKSFSRGLYGDIIHLVCEKKRINSKEALKIVFKFYEISNNINIKESEKNNNSKIILDFFKKINRKNNDPYKILDESLISHPIVSNMLLRDYISEEVQKKFKIHYDFYSQRICFNWRDIYGNLVGITGRLNDTHIRDDELRYDSVVNFKKGNFLFGFWENMNDITRNKMAIITESEKGVLQLRTYGYNYGLGVGSSSISKGQINILKMFKIDTIIFSFDNDRTENEIRNQIKKIKEQIPNCNCFFIKDKDEKYISEKMSPTDSGKDIFDKLMKGCLYD
jgi:hypothetical protein